jgi:hypothetical protein
VTEQTERIVYEESVRTVDWQRELLEGLRSRAGALLATAFVATAFFAAQALHGRREDPLEWLATALFLIVVVSALIVLIPWRLQFFHHPHSLVAYHLDVDPPRDPNELYRTLAYWNGLRYNQNGRKLEVLFGVFGIACASLVAETVVWLIVLGGV